MPGDPGATVVTNARAYYHYTRGCGCNGHPAFPAPPWGSATPSLGRRISAQLGRFALRECEAVFPGCCWSGVHAQGGLPMGPGSAVHREKRCTASGTRARWCPQWRCGNRL